jgi:ABC-type transport system involved in multi-copper enzyme maturation permease subunit
VYLQTLAGALRAELLKLDKRPAVWVLLGISLGLLAVFTYLLNWVLFSHPPPGMNLPAGSEARRSLYPQHMVSTALAAGSLPSALALILGVLLIGSEYNWGTFKTLFTQRPGRLQTLFAKLLAMEIALGAGALLYFFTAAVCSIVVAALDGQPPTGWPGGDTMLEGILASWLTWSWWAMFGAALAVAFRQSALAIGLGLAYSFVVEGLVFSLGGAFGGQFIRDLQKFFPGPNASALAESFAMAVPGSPPPHPLVGAGQACVVLILYCLAAAMASSVLVVNRDVT